MTKRDFLVLVIKLFGLYSAVNTLFSALPGNIVYYMYTPDSNLIALVILSTLVIAALFYLLTFKAGYVVDALRLGKGFSDERIELANLKGEDIIKIGTFLIGGYLFIKSIPGLLSQSLWAFKGEIRGHEFSTDDKVKLGISAINVLVGFLLITNYDRVARLLNRKEESRPD